MTKSSGYPRRHYKSPTLQAPDEIIPIPARLQSENLEAHTIYRAVDIMSITTVDSPERCGLADGARCMMGLTYGR